MEKYSIFWNGSTLLKRVLNKPYCEPILKEGNPIIMEQFILFYVFNPTLSPLFWNDASSKLPFLVKPVYVMAPYYVPSEEFICFNDFALVINTGTPIPIHYLIERNIICSLHFDVKVIYIYLYLFLISIDA
jgi:hypothetical protein